MRARYAAAAMPPYFQTQEERGPESDHARAQASTGTPDSPQATPAYDDPLQEADAGYGAYRGAHPGAYRADANRSFRLLVMAGVFIVGAAAGLAGAVWFKVPQVVSNAGISGTAAASLPGSTHLGAQALIGGIRAGELPYDGMPPPEIYGSVSTTADAAKSEGSSQLSVSRGDTGAGTAKQVAAISPGSAETPGRAVSAQQSVEAAKPVPRKPSQSRVARGREISRIKQQAAAELKKKTEKSALTRVAESKRQSSSGHRPHPRGRRSHVASVKAALAVCRQKSNFIEREVCKWRLCSGKWGENGCPSYQHPGPSY